LKILTLYDHGTSTSQTDRQIDDLPYPSTVLCTKLNTELTKPGRQLEEE